MRRLLSVLLLFAGALTLAYLPDLGAPRTAVGESALATLYLDLQPSAATKGMAPLVSNTIPPNCSTWHELAPVYCNTYHQDSYTDNGDGVVSPCDIIHLNGLPYHIRWVGPTYFVTCSPTPGGPPVRTAAFEPVNPYPPTANPVCQIWHEVWPNFCDQIHIDSFHDNGNGILDECDYVDVQTANGTIFYHIDRIGCNIIVDPVPITPNEKQSWGWLKNLFKRG